MGKPEPDLDELHTAVGGMLGAADQRYTTGRRRLVELLAAADRPVTIPEIVGADPDVALSSAYRNLTALEQVGAVARIVSGAEHVRFELAEDLVGEHHHHLICESCGRVEDFTVPPALERSMERALAGVLAERTFVASTHRLDLVGTCADCATG